MSGDLKSETHRAASDWLDALLRHCGPIESVAFMGWWDSETENLRTISALSLEELKAEFERQNGAAAVTGTVSRTGKTIQQAATGSGIEEGAGMSERMTDERLAEIERSIDRDEIWKRTYASRLLGYFDELLRGLKAERRHNQEMFDIDTSVIDELQQEIRRLAGRD